MRRALPVSAALGLGVALTLSGCFGNPLEQITDGIIGGGVEQIIEDQTGVDVDVNGSGASLPDNWPSEVPTVSGDILFSGSADNQFSAAITVGSMAEAERAFTEMLDAGFTEISSADLGAGGKTRVYENQNWSVGIIIAENTDGTAIVQYTVSPASS